MNYLDEIQNMNILNNNIGLFVKNINPRIFHIRFCTFCGDYLEVKHNFIINEIKCKCDNNLEFYFDEFREAIISWPIDFDGDCFDDAFENMNNCHESLKRYMIQMALFTILKKKYIIFLDNDDIMSNIYEFI